VIHAESDAENISERGNSLTQPTDEPKNFAQAPPGRVAQPLLRWFMRSAHLAAVETLSPHFRLADLEGEALRNVTWAAGQKVQVSMGAGFSSRTYTPISWDAATGRTRLLIFTHGDGPGSRWASGLRKGDTCHLFGPRGSLDLSGLGSPLVVFGDETSFALAAALRNSPHSQGVIHLFEASDVAESRQVLETIGIGQATLIQRIADDAHLGAVEGEASRLAASDARFVLTGKASSIQRVSRVLKTVGIASSRVKTKAYWAQGKTGLD
jgi:ferric-chelate reductase (NADPH)